MKKRQKSINLLNSLTDYFLENKLINPNQGFLIALSGGQDSISNLFLFFILKNQWGLEIKIFYCNHLLQKETFYTFLHLSKLSFIFNISFSYIITLNFINSENKSRIWRLNVYERLLNFKEFNFLLLGHTQSDQIETFFFNLLRGAGLKGSYSLKKKKKLQYFKKQDVNISKSNLYKFKNIKNKQIIKNYIFRFRKKNFKKDDFLSFRNNFSYLLQKKNFHQIFFVSTFKNKFFFEKKIFKKKFIIRSLLKQRRFDNEKVSNNWKLPVLPDKSNEKNFYTRNRIRKQLLPTLRFFFNSQLDLSLWKYNQILIQEQKIIENILNLIFGELITENKNFFCLNLKFFYSFPLGIQKKISFIFFEKKLYLKINFFLINRFIFLVNNKFESIKKLKQINTIKKISFYNLIFCSKIGIFFIYKTTIIIFK